MKAVGSNQNKSSCRIFSLDTKQRRRAITFYTERHLVRRTPTNNIRQCNLWQSKCDIYWRAISANCTLITGKCSQLVNVENFSCKCQLTFVIFNSSFNIKLLVLHSCIDTVNVRNAKLNRKNIGHRAGYSCKLSFSCF